MLSRKFSLFILISGLLLSLIPVSAINAATTPEVQPLTSSAAEILREIDLTSSLATAATTSNTVDPNAKQVILEKKDKDLTEPVNKKTDTLTTYVIENKTDQLNWYNFIQHSIYQAIINGLPANIIVLIIMFPLVASIIAFSRHVIGVKGFGIYAPAVLSIAFVSTGIKLGITMFILIILFAILTKWILKKISLPHLPKTALLLWGVSIGVLFFLLFAAILDWQFFFQISIFPLLIIMLLSENFMESQLFSSQKEALKLTLETIFVATICALIISWEPLQKIVILNPELTLITIAAINILIGKFTGLRLLEYLRFNSIISPDKE